ncbi:MAG TPA: class I SAM-dependent methyltransferase [bacterium]|nr:class I SAM-dependent methyltransferase [bacterium]
MSDMRNQKDFFNTRAESWDNGRKMVSREDYCRIVIECGICSGQTVLDVGTGTGVIIPYILEKTGEKGTVFAIDYAEKMIERLIKKNFPSNVKALVMDIHKTDFKDSFFDGIVANACYPHFARKKTALKEIFRLLKKGGVFVISHPMGRNFINNLHRNAHGIVEKDIVPDIPQLRSLAESCGFRFIQGADEENFFFVSFTK